MLAVAASGSINMYDYFVRNGLNETIGVKWRHECLRLAVDAGSVPLVAKFRFRLNK